MLKNKVKEFVDLVKEAKSVLKDNPELSNNEALKIAKENLKEVEPTNKFNFKK